MKRLPLYSRASFGRSLLGNSFVSLLTRVAGSIFTFVAAANIEQTELGYLFLGLGVLSFCSTLAAFGTPGSLNHFTTVFLCDSRTRQLSTLITSSLRLVVVSGLLMGFFLYLFSGAIATKAYGTPEAQVFISLAAIGVPGFALTMLLTGVLRGLQETAFALFIETTVWRLSHLLLLTMVLLIGLKTQHLMLGMMLVPLLMLGWSLASLRRRAIIRGLTEGFNLNRRFLVYSVNSWVTGIANTVNSRADTILLGVFVTANEIAVFVVAATLGSLLLLSANIIAPAFRPVAARLIREGNSSEFIYLYKTIIRFNILIIAPLSIYLALFSTDIVVTLFGEGYAQASNLLSILILGILPGVLMGPANPALLAMGREEVVRNIDIATSLLFLLLFTILAHSFGLFGAACAVATYGVIQHGLKNYVVRRFYRIPWSPSWNISLFLVVASIMGGLFYLVATTIIPWPDFAWALLFPFYGVTVLGLALGCGVLKLDEVRRITRLLNPSRSLDSPL